VLTAHVPGLRGKIRGGGWHVVPARGSGSRHVLHRCFRCRRGRGLKDKDFIYVYGELTAD
jgi:hypothetical protein